MNQPGPGSTKGRVDPFILTLSLLLPLQFLVAKPYFS